MKETNELQEIKYINSNKSTLFCNKEAVPYIKMNIFEKYDKDIIHGFSTRYGGVSKEHLYSLNLSYNRGDETENVTKNHMRFAEALGYDYKKTVFSDQVHDIKIKKCTLADAGKGITKESDIKAIDGLVTNEKGLPLMTFYADCVPLFFYDPDKKVVATAHSGWRGTVADMGGEMVRYMVKEYGCREENIVTAIGPSICQSCYEVSEDVITEFEKKYSSLEMNNLIIKKENGKFLLNLHEACKYNFIHAGILNENIGVTDICTCCNPKILFSHRASNGKRGNLAAVIMLK